MRRPLRWLARYAEAFLASWAYSFQTFTVAEVLTASKMNQVEVNIRDHQHGVSGVVGTLTISAEQNLSGTSIDFTVPSGVKAVDICLSGASGNGTSQFLLQLGDAGGIETSGYVSGFTVSGTFTTSAAGFLLSFAPSGSDTHSVHYRLVLERSSTNLWVGSGASSRSSDGATGVGSGQKALSQELTTIRITTVNGTDAYDAGVGSIVYLY